MNYLLINNLTKSYGDRVLFQNISFGVSEGQKVALVGNNGTGKSSLMNIIVGKDTPDTGEIVFNNQVRWAYLSQNPEFNENHTVTEAIFNTNDPVFKALKQYEAIKDDPEKLDELIELISVIDDLQAWDMEAKVQTILAKLYITDFEKPIRELSGGQKKRVALASLLISNPNLLIIDEPTNHLDLDIIEWLEEYLIQSNITLLMVTHDRYFLNRVCTEIIEIDNQTVYRYKGNYEYFLEKKAEREFNLMQSVEKAQNTLVKELEWMRRQPKARGTKAKARIDAFYDVKEVASQRIENKTIELNVKVSRIGGKILELHSVCKGFNDKVILDKFTYTFKHGEKIGIIGKNGVGKSTFLKLITQEITPDTGTIKTGETLVYGYYKQEATQFDPQKRVIEVVRDIADFIPLNNGKNTNSKWFANHVYVSTTHAI